MTVHVVTDSSAVIPQSWRDDLPLRIVPLELAWPDGSVSPGNVPYEAIAQRLRDAPAPPKTGAPAPGTYHALISELLERSDGVLVVCPSSDLSATYASAVLGARQVADERVRVLDSKTAAAGQGLVTLEAARSGAGGHDVDTVCDHALAVASRVSVWATLAQLEFLRRSGRLPAIATMSADALGLQPVVRYGSGGSPTPVGVVRSMRRGADRLFRAWERSAPGDQTGRTVVFHSARSADAEDIHARMVAYAPGVDAQVVEVSASLAAHTGPGLLGVAWFWDN